MKDEFNRVEIDEFVVLKSKMYSLLAKNGLEVNKGNGVNLKLRHKLYFNVQSNKKVARHKMKRILSEKYRIDTYEINKICFICSDDKRYILDDGTNTLAFFHKDIDTNREY